jgi:hypothetical protein
VPGFGLHENACVCEHVRVQCLTNFAIKAFCTSRNNNWTSYCSAKCKMLLCEVG